MGGSVPEDEMPDHANGRGLVMQAGDEAGDLRTDGRVANGQTGGLRPGEWVFRWARVHGPEERSQTHALWTYEAGLTT